jgi:hypothetical protein
MTIRRLLVVLLALSLFAAACGDDDDDAGDDSGDVADDGAGDDADDADDADDGAGDDGDDADDGDSMGFVDEGRSIDAPAAEITVDGDAADWADIEGLDLTLHAIMGEDFPSQESTVKVAHDDDNVYVLLTVEDDYDWDPEDLHLSAANGIQWAVDSGAGEAMGATDEDRETSLGTVDIWHWELECPAGAQSGGEVSGPGEDESGEPNDAGNDDACNFDDEYATATEEREDDNGEGAENSLLGVWTHTSDVAGEDGTWTFEMKRPLQTGDAGDAQFEVGSSSQLAIAYWDADSTPEGWEDEHHVVSANQGWITVNFT